MRLLDKVIFSASDLHIGSPMTHPETIRAIENGIVHSDIAIFSGDIWEGLARHWPFRKRLQACKHTIERWAKKAAMCSTPKWQIYLDGNHELPVYRNGFVNNEAADLMAAVKEHGKQFPHVVFHPKHWFQHGDAVFTHGHIELGFIDTPHSWLRSRIERVTELITPGLPTELVMPRERTVRLIHKAMESEALEGPVNHIVFGHLHTPFTGVSVPGLRLGGQDIQFHNSGVSYKPRKLFNPLFMEFDGDFVSNVRQSNLQHLMHPERAHGR